MTRFNGHNVSRRDAMKISVMGAGALTVTAAGGGRFLIDKAGAQATPEGQAFDRTACYQSFEGAEPVQYEKLADPPYNIALVYNGLDMREETLDWLGRGYRQRDPKMTFLKVDRKWNNLRSDPRFADLVRKVGLPQ